MLKATAKRVARALLGDYALFYIYTNESPATPPVAREDAVFDVRRVHDEGAVLRDSAEELLREQSFYGGFQSACFGCFAGDALAGVCFYWFGERYRQRNFWPLREGEAKLVQVVVLPQWRGRGAATTLIGESARAMAADGFRRLYARIWHSNAPSLHAFERAGWRRIALVVEVNPLRSRPIRFTKSLQPRGTSISQPVHHA